MEDKRIIKKIKIKNLFILCDVDNTKYYQVQKGRYSIKINTPQGFKEIQGYVKKNNLDTWEVNINGASVKGAATHRVKIEGEWKQLQDFEEKKHIGVHDLYDVAVTNPHEYYSTNGIIHHNTSLAKALCKDIEADYKYINVSLDNGIDTLRSTISKYASTKSFTGTQKIVILDEADFSSSQFQAGLRGVIEEFHKVCRFIFTCNYVTKIIEPIRSRCQEYDMSYSDAKTVAYMKPEILKRLELILKHQKVEYEIPTLNRLLDLHYPDIRKTIQLCQQYSSINGNIDNNILSFEKVDDEFYSYLIEKKFNKARKYVIENNCNLSEMYTNLYKDFVPKLQNHLQPQVIITIAEYMNNHPSAIDPEINFAACMLDIMKII